MGKYKTADRPLDLYQPLNKDLSKKAKVRYKETQITLIRNCGLGDFPMVKIRIKLEENSLLEEKYGEYPQGTVMSVALT